MAAWWSLSTSATPTSTGKKPSARAKAEIVALTP